MKDRIGMGIIGAGFMGMLQARAISQLPDAFIAGISDPAMKEAPEILGLSKPVAFYNDHNKLLENGPGIFLKKWAISIISLLHVCIDPANEF